MTEPPAADPLAPLPRALLSLGGACTASVVIALVAALFGLGVPPLWVLALPPLLVAAVLAVLASRTRRRSDG